MARSPGTAFGRAGLSPFRRTTTGFGIFSLSNSNDEAYYEFTKVNVRWQAGLASDDEYLAALQTYANSFDTDSSEYLNAQERVRDARYTIARNKILAGIEKGTKSYDDLLEFDLQSLADAQPGNQYYRDLSQNVSNDKDKAAYATFDKVRNQWQAGNVKDTDYLAAFQTYVSKLTNPDDREAAQLQLDSTRYTLDRNKIVTAINKGTASYADLLNFDQQALSSGVVPGSDEYRSRLARLQQTQRAVFSDMENDIHDKWSAGKMTTAQLLKWYQDAQNGSLAAGNADLQNSITDQIQSLQLRVTDEKDTKVVDDFNQGHMSANAFLAYARDARDRYASNTPQYRDWQQRIDDATQRTVEDNLLYRYGLTNDYANLKRFVQTNKTAPWAGGSVSEETRWVLGDDGNWKPVTTTKTTPYTPTADQKQSWAEVQAQVAASKQQMQYIERQIGKVPGGWVTNEQMLSYYQGVQNTYQAGSSEWYQIQDRIDAVHQALAQETVYKTLGTTVSYPWTPNDSQKVGANPKGTGAGKGYSNPGPSYQYVDPKTGRTWGNAPVRHEAGTVPKGNGITIDDFLYALGGHESNNNYNARNGTTGAYGKYQHLPQYWPSRAARYLGNANAPMTPENQEKVTRAMIQKLYDRWGDWRLVALAWHNGHVSSTDPASWSLRNQKYVNRVMNVLGSDMWTPTTRQGIYLPNDWTAGGGTPPGKLPKPSSVTTSPPPGSGKDTTSPPGTTQAPPVTATNKPGVPSEPGTGPKFLREITPGGQVVPVGLPTWAADNPGTSGVNFEAFYTEFQRAYANGRTSFTISGTVYKIPASPDLRQKMMSQLDNIRIDLYQNQSVAYTQAGDTDMARVADSKYSGATADYGTNILIGITQPGQESTKPVKGEHFGLTEQMSQDKTNYNPLADAQDYLARQQSYFDTQERLAQEAFDRGDWSAAVSIIKRTQNHYDAVAVTMTRFVRTAEAEINSAQHLTGVDVPANTQKIFDQMANWQTTLKTPVIDKIYNELFGDGTAKNPGIIKTRTVGGKVIPDLNPSTGQVQLRDDKVPVLQDDGTVKAVTQDRGNIDPRTGQPLDPTQSNRVKIQVQIGNSVQTVEREFKVDVVGYFTDAQGNRTKIYGRVAYDPTTGKYWNENPMNPGHWSPSIYDIKLPPTATVQQDKNYPTDATKTTVEFNYNGITYRLGPANDKSGEYVFGKWDPATETYVSGTTRTSSATDVNLNTMLSQAGFVRDTSFVAPGDRAYSDVALPAFGFANGWSYNAWVTRNNPPVPGQNGFYGPPLPPNLGGPSTASTVTWGGFNPNLAVPKLDPTGTYPVGTTLGPPAPIPSIQTPEAAVFNPNAGAYTYDKTGKKVPRVLPPPVTKVPDYLKTTALQDQNALVQEHIAAKREPVQTAAQKRAAAAAAAAKAAANAAYLKKQQAAKKRALAVTPPPTRKQTFFDQKDPFA